MELNSKKIEKIVSDYGDAFYILDSEQFKQNFFELKEAFLNIYPNFNVAYSYKTNYTPKLCRIVNELGGFAEVVSDMEMEIALRVGVEPSKIIWNGPFKNAAKVEELLVMGGTVNIDSVYEIDIIKKIIHRHPSCIMNLGIRCNFDINDGVISRFGFDVHSEEFHQVVNFVKNTKNIHLINMQCHFATRRIETWETRAKKMLDLLDKLNFTPERIDLGGGLFGKMADSLKEQFDSYIPSYQEYANVVATLFKEKYGDLENKPLLVIEPGSALVGDCMKFMSKVVNIKTVRGKSIATILGSVYNINPTLNTKNPPIKVYSMGEGRRRYRDLDFGGFTCIESDYLYKHFDGELAVGDVVEFSNVGSYSLVLKPPFILPNFPVVDICDEEIEVIKRGENFGDLFQTYLF